VIKCNFEETGKEEIIGRFHKKTFDIQSNYVNLVKLPKKVAKWNGKRDKISSLQMKILEYNLLK